MFVDVSFATPTPKNVSLRIKGENARTASHSQNRRPC